MHKDSPVSETVFPLFWGDQVFASQIKTKEELYRVTPTLVSGSVLSLPSLVQSQTPDQCIKTVQYPKQFFPLFLGDQVFASQIKTKEELYRVTPTLVSGSVLSLQSQTPDQHIETVQCPKQFILFFGDQEWNQLLWKSAFRHPCTFCTKSNARSEHEVSPVSKTILHLFWGTKSLHHRSTLNKSYVRQKLAVWCPYTLGRWHCTYK